MNQKVFLTCFFCFFFILIISILTNKQVFALYGAGPKCKIVSCGSCLNNTWFCLCQGCQCDTINGGSCQASTKENCLSCYFECQMSRSCDSQPTYNQCFDCESPPNPNPPTPTPTPTPYVRIQIRNQQLTPIQVAQTCKVNCAPTPCSNAYITPPCYNDVNSASFPGDGDRTGVMLYDQRYLVLGVTPSNSGSYSEDCLGRGDYYYCYYWDRWSTGGRTATFIVATPTPYPTVAIGGNLKEYLGACYDGISTNNLSITLVPQNSTGISILGPTITESNNVKTGYQFYVHFNNQPPYPTPVQSFSLNASALGYSSAYWTENNNCSPNSANTITIDVSSPNPTTNFNKDIFFQNTTPWVKIKDGSFSALSSLTNYIPLNITGYDSDDFADQRYFIINNPNNPANDPGVVTAQTITIQPDPLSQENWYVNGYSKANYFTPSDFIDYIKSKKEYKEINELSSIDGDGIYLINSGLNLTNLPSQPSKLVLIINGNVNITDQYFNINNNCLSTINSIAILSTETITFSDSTKCAAGIFIANIINTGSTENQGLKIKGNLVALQSFTNNRNWQDNSKPSFFVVFEPKFYLDLLPYLSTATYDYRQIQ